MAMGVWVFTAGHAATAWEFGLLVMGLSWAGFEAAIVWLVYIAVEPYVRRNWPDSLISWTLALCSWRYLFTWGSRWCGF